MIVSSAAGLNFSEVTKSNGGKQDLKQISDIF